ncbi:hypothetical protein FJT64_023020 [Amphibalanus amphitrite]|uniref:Uncharacterized protein n=1 Tax=Amphibalanus amphitrite TaxID=1232801 RepID=A0A6A4WH21_AMPAM|nr:hypothetical protein FJT64_023020 [Amphibalanus amphitrite]
MFVFPQVLRRLEIPHIVCLNDATAEFTALARKLDCPIMGIQNKYLTQNIVAVKVPRKRAVLQLRHSPPGQKGFYMPCEVFHPERFLKKFDISVEMLPLVSTIPGTGPHPPALFDAFFEKLEELLHSVEREQFRRLDLLMRWLSDQDSIETALKEARLSALLGAPTQPLVLLGTVHRGENHQLLASCTWRAPLLERVLLGGEQSRLRAALSTLQLRPNTLDALPELLRLPAAALVEWRRVTTPRSGRRQVRAVLLTLLAMTPADTPPSALGLSASAAAEWRARAWPWRFAQPSRGRTDRKAMHLQNELQDVYKTVLSVNEVLDQPLQQLDVVDTIHVPMTTLFGFASSGDAITEPEGEVMSLVDAVADTVEEEVRWWLNNGRQESGSAGGVSPHRAHCRTRSCNVLSWFPLVDLQFRF